MSKSWGHGFHQGKEHGEYWGALLESGKWEIELSDKANELLILANALRLPVEVSSGRTETWWQLYVGAIAKKIEAVAKSMPSTIGGVYEFESEIKDKEND